MRKCVRVLGLDNIYANVCNVIKCTGTFIKPFFFCALKFIRSMKKLRSIHFHKVLAKKSFAGMFLPSVVEFPAIVHLFITLYAMCVYCILWYAKNSS